MVGESRVFVQVSPEEGGQVEWGARGCHWGWGVVLGDMALQMGLQFVAFGETLKYQVTNCVLDCYSHVTGL